MRAKARGDNEKDAFLNHMSMDDVNMLLTSLLPVIKLEAGKYMIGTEKKPILIKSNKLMLRVGGGYATLEEYLK